MGLVDGGSVVTCISDVTCQRLELPVQPSSRNLKVTVANGDGMEVLGQVVIELQIGNTREKCAVYVCANLKESVIIGPDVLVSRRCVVDSGNSVLQVGGETVPLTYSNNFISSSLHAIEDFEIPAKHEIMVPAQLQAPFRGEGIIEPSDFFQGRTDAMVARILVQADNDTVPVRIANPSSSPMQVRRGTTLGELHGVSFVPQTCEAQSRNLVSQHSSSKVPTTLEVPREIFGDKLSQSEVQCLRHVIDKYEDVFAKDESDLGRTKLVYHAIDTGDASPVRKRPYRIPVHLQGEVQRQLGQMLDNGVVETSTSPWSAPILLCKKKSGQWRFVADYRGLNAVTRKNAFPLPRIDETLDALSGSTLFSVLDLASAYWQVEVAPEDREKTAFVTSEGLYQFKVMPYGLCNAPSTYQRLMQCALAGLHWKTCLIYLDDIIVFASTFQEHVQRLEEVLQKLRVAGLKLQTKKCRLACSEVVYLGHRVSADGISPDLQKIAAVSQYPRPTKVSELQSFLGLASYYRRFVKDFSKIAAPLHRLTHKSVPFIWDPSCENAFQRLKVLLTSPPTLRFPDFNLPFHLSTDASSHALGGILSQKVGKVEHVIAYASRSLNKAERQYATTEREALALVWATDHFRPYLYGRTFTLVTDHNPLVWLRRMKEPKGKFARWLMKLEEFDYAVEYKPGRAHGNADALSRTPEVEPPSLESVNMLQLTPEHTIQDVRELQMEDQSLREVLRQFDKYGELKYRPRLGKSAPYWRIRKRLLLRDGTLCRRWKESRRAAEVIQLVPPTSMREDILRAAHNDLASGHFGSARTLHRIQEKYYWPGMNETVETWCRECHDCATRKPANPTNNRAPMISIPPPEKPFQMIAIDIAGPFPTSAKSNRFILVCVDYLSKWPVAVALPNQEASTIADALMDRVFSEFGIPEVILSDQGRNFESRLFKELCRLLCIRKVRTSVLHPQTDGLVERFNRTLLDRLAMYVSSNQTDWDDFLPHALLAYRTSVHESTKMTPASLLLSFQPRLPIDLLSELPSRTPEADCPEPYAERTRQRLREALDTARENIQAAQSRQKEAYDRSSAGIKFNVGDRVWVHNRKRVKGKSPKLSHPWHGPYTITETVTPVTYRLQPDTGRKVIVAHHNRLKKCFTREFVATRRYTSTNQEQRQALPDTDSHRPPKRTVPPSNSYDTTHIINAPPPTAQSPEVQDGREVPELRNTRQPQQHDRPVRTRRPPDRYGLCVTYE